MSAELEIEAMLIRHAEAVKMVRPGNGAEMLLMVVCPPPSLRAASLQAATERGASPLACKLARARARGEWPELTERVKVERHEAPARRVITRRKGRRRVMTIDELLATA